MTTTDKQSLSFANMVEDSWKDDVENVDGIKFAITQIHNVIKFCELRNDINEFDNLLVGLNKLALRLNNEIQIAKNLINKFNEVKEEFDEDIIDESFQESINEFKRNMLPSPQKQIENFMKGTQQEKENLICNANCKYEADNLNTLSLALFGRNNFVLDEVGKVLLDTIAVSDNIRFDENTGKISVKPFGNNSRDRNLEHVLIVGASPEVPEITKTTEGTRRAVINLTEQKLVLLSDLSKVYARNHVVKAFLELQELNYGVYNKGIRGRGKSGYFVKNDNCPKEWVIELGVIGRPKNKLNIKK